MECFGDKNQGAPVLSPNLNMGTVLIWGEFWFLIAVTVHVWLLGCYGWCSCLSTETGGWSGMMHDQGDCWFDGCWDCCCLDLSLSDYSQ